MSVNTVLDDLLLVSDTGSTRTDLANCGSPPTSCLLVSIKFYWHRATPTGPILPEAAFVLEADGIVMTSLMAHKACNISYLAFTEKTCQPWSKL